MNAETRVLATKALDDFDRVRAAERDRMLRLLTTDPAAQAEDENTGKSLGEHKSSGPSRSRASNAELDGPSRQEDRVGSARPRSRSPVQALG